jgi:general secretion pathway protein E
MLRFVSRMLTVALVWTAQAQISLAQTPEFWPPYSEFAPTKFPRGGGFYFNLFRIVVAWLMLLLWIKTVDWMNRDGQQTRQNYRRWNLIAFGSFVAAFALLFVVPWFWLDLLLMMTAYGVPLFLYVRQRNAALSDDEHVFTQGHIRFWLSEKLKPFGIKIAAEPPGKKEQGPPVTIIPKGGANDTVNSANLMLARQAPGFLYARQLLADAIDRRSEAVHLTFTQESVAVHFIVDGFPHAAEPRDRVSGDALLEVLKMVAALNKAERRAKQQGTFNVEYGPAKRTARIVSQGTQTGERVVVELDDGGLKNKRLPDLGMSEKLLEALREVLERKNGVVVLSAPADGGLTTLLAGTVLTMDRFMRSFVAIEDVANHKLEVENVVLKTFDTKQGETAGEALAKAVRDYPDVIVMADMVDGATGAALFKEAIDDRLAMTTVRAKEAAEALLRVLMLKVPGKSFAPVLSGVVNQRLIRKLCSKCKEADPLSPQIAQQLRMPAGTTFYRTPQAPPPGEKAPPICTECLGIGYRGRTAMFELLVVTDPVRQALVSKTLNLDLMRQVVRKSGLKSLQQSGIELVVAGVTSYVELMRILKEKD